jgi:Family of unknown function (DUF5996)
VIGEFRAGFVGKASPVHFFWGAMDLACTRFSGRTAPPHPGGVPNCPDRVMREAYSHELASCGFWPGGGEEGAFYTYAYPEPAGFADHPVGPAAAYYSPELGEFLLPYEAVAGAASPNRVLQEFLDTTYAAAADLAGRRRWPQGPRWGALQAHPAGRAPADHLAPAPPRLLSASGVARIRFSQENRCPEALPRDSS